MSNIKFNYLPSLSHQEALAILSKPFGHINSRSDFYKAVFHLAKYPCEQTEKALLIFLDVQTDKLEIKIAQRKAVEILGDLGCESAIPALGRCLKSEDPYLVANAAWSLHNLGCNDHKLHSLIISKLDEPKQNRRLLIQALSGLDVSQALPKINSLLKEKDLPVEIRCAAIAAKYRFDGDNKYIHELKSLIRSPNQNTRHCAINDVINSNNISLLKFVLESPISSAFKIRAIESLSPQILFKFGEIELFRIIQSLILDEPEDIYLPKKYDGLNTVDFLIEQLFSTQFDICYQALRIIKKLPPSQIIFHLDKQWLRASKDYGALYFFASLYRSLLSKGYKVPNIVEKIDFMLSDSWSDYMRFRMSAIISLMYVDKQLFLNRTCKFLDEYYTPYWINRYSALWSLEKYNKCKLVIDLVKKSLNDSNIFVSSKAKMILQRSAI